MSQHSLPTSLTSSATRRAVALISGGLDSMLAAKLMIEQGIAVAGLNFYTGFCHSGHTSAIRRREQDTPKRNDALWVAQQLNIPLYIIDVVEEYKKVLTKPKHGYGENLNPCLDCKIFMVKKAKQWMVENNFDFIITGEVIGQRPKSQRKVCMPIVATESGADDYLLRPLCAKNLAPTLPEREGWVDREKLLGLSGRSRKPQITLAKQHGFDDHAQPAGGCCVLTDMYYSRKLKDFWQARGNKEYELDDVLLLKVGRHLRPKNNFKLIIGREEGENNFLEGYRKQFPHIRIVSHEGPLVLIDGSPSVDDILLAARISARFSAGRAHEEVLVQIENFAQEPTRTLKVRPLAAEEIPQAWYL